MSYQEELREAQLASDSLIRRIRMMAEFIQETNPQGFRRYWNGKWPGKATADETLDFFATPGLESRISMGKKIV